MNTSLKEQIELLCEANRHEDIITLLKSKFGEEFFAWDYEVLGEYARACANLERYEESIEILDMPGAKNENDWKWHYRKMYAHFNKASLEDNDEYAKDDEKVLLYGEHLLKMDENDPLDAGVLEHIKYMCHYALLNTKGKEAADEFDKRYNYTPDDSFHVTYYSEDEMDAVQKHYDDEFGKSENVLHEIVSEIIHCDIVIVPPDEINRCYTLCTMGVGAVSMDAVSDEMMEEYGTLDRMELVIQLPSDWNINSDDERDYWPIRWLKILARMPYSYNTFLDYWHTIPTAQPLEGTDFVCFLLVPPLTKSEANGSTIFLPNGDKVAILQLVPLYKEEMEYKLEYGVNALIDKLTEFFSKKDGQIDEVAVVTIGRKNVCEGFVSEDERFFVLDSYSWNFDEGEELPPIKENLDYLTKPCYFLQFCFDNKLLFEGFEQIFAKEIVKKSLPEFAAEFLEGNFTQDELNELGLSFAKSYYRSNMDVSYVVEIENLFFEKYGESKLKLSYNEEFYREFVEPLLRKRFDEFMDYYYGESENS